MLMHPLDLPHKLPALDPIVVELVGMRQGSEFRARKLGQWVEIQAIDASQQDIQDRRDASNPQDLPAHGGFFGTHSRESITQLQAPNCSDQKEH